jgi:hypothetical protein
MGSTSNCKQSRGKPTLSWRRHGAPHADSLCRLGAQGDDDKQVEARPVKIGDDTRCDPKGPVQLDPLHLIQHRATKGEQASRGVRVHARVEDDGASGASGASGARGQFRSRRPSRHLDMSRSASSSVLLEPEHEIGSSTPVTHVPTGGTNQVVPEEWSRHLT